MLVRFVAWAIFLGMVTAGFIITFEILSFLWRVTV